tara:strand:+ start:60 stop:722 length:663 start_codon:yes stop_codon:yes gene_type:complete
MKSFYEIGLPLSDKVDHHRYDRFYPPFLESLRDQEFNMLEVGLGDGSYPPFIAGGGLKLWKEYFPHSYIYVIDIKEEGEDDRSKIFKLDQSKEEDLQYIVDNIPKCKFIIDDGSHHPYHQFITFIKLFEELLEDGGVYIIEDIECNYWNPKSNVYGYEIGHFNTLDYFKNTLDQINSEFSNKKNHLKISTVTFAHNCIIITKQTPEEANISNRNYRFKQY